ncbi:transcription elongation factor GreA, partial [Burkholderia sp. SIMBA_019]|uniref:transcription elongation factor GreA n=1 Tax=Burkholderia sp. SIMBA_019 TaxID=3085765 RepID=UPI00397DAD05
MTKRGADQLRGELQRLKSVERPAVINSIAEARAQGDLSENAEYDAAKEKQGFIEGRIAEIESKLAAAQVIDPSTLEAEGRVVF